MLSDGYIANGAEPWQIPDAESLPKIPISHPGPLAEGETFYPYERDELLARPWALPGTKGLQHRIGALEKADRTGNVIYDSDNHQHMTNVRAQKVANVAQVIPPLGVMGPESGDLLVVSWGGTYGACKTAVERCQQEGHSVAHAHLRWLNPFPSNFGAILKNYKKILVPELNMGQLRILIRSKFLVDARPLNKVKGRPFAISELMDAIRETLK